MFGVPIEVLVGASVFAGLTLLAAVFLAERASSRRAARRAATPARGSRTASAVPTPRRPVEVAEPEPAPDLPAGRDGARLR